MTSDVTLSAALRNNLLSLENTQNQINTHQQRLATGKKVNSALDNPQSFFAAQALTNRASDLSTILDGLSQSIQVINAANNGVTALTSLINQQQSIANTAQTTLAGASTNATVTGNTNLGTAKLNTVSGISTNDTLTFTVTDPSGAANPINGVGVAIGGSQPSVQRFSFKIDRSERECARDGNERFHQTLPFPRLSGRVIDFKNANTGITERGAVSISIKPRTQHHNLTDAILQCRRKSVLRKTRSHRNEEAHAPLGWVICGLASDRLSVLAQNANSKRIAENSSAFQDLVRRAVSRSGERSLAGLSSLQQFR
jgi:hypothetical protein